MAAQPEPNQPAEVSLVRSPHAADLAAAAARAAALSASIAHSALLAAPPNDLAPIVDTEPVFAEPVFAESALAVRPAPDVQPVAAFRTGWPALLATTAARIVLGMLAALLFWSVIPTVLGWHSTVVQTGSMQPRIQPGDVVAARPVAVSQLRPGQIALVQDPDHQNRLRLHRIIRFDAAGNLILRGDANRADDSSPVAPAAVRGIGSLRVPKVGMPMLWAREHRWPNLIGLAAVLVALVAAAGLYRSPEPEGAVHSDQPDADSSNAIGGNSIESDQAAAVASRRAGSHRLPRRRNSPRRGLTAAATALGLLAALAAITIGKPAPAAAATKYTKSASNASNSFAAQPYFTCKAAVLSNTPYLYYRLNESSGTSATDTSGNSRTGAYHGTGINFGGTDSCARDSSAAVTFNGRTGNYVSTPTLVTGPNTFTEEIWFKTTSTQGGRLIGFGSSQTGASTNYDRHLYLADSGQVVFAVHPNAVKIVASASSYNDGAWHLADATLSSAGIALYVDGQLVGSNTSTTTGQSYSGYWRIGYDNLGNSGSTTPTSEYFAGSLDDAAVYSTALTATQISSHNAAGR